MQFHTNKFKKRVVLKNNTDCKLELLSERLWGWTKKHVDQDKDGEDATKLESVEVVLVHCNLVHSNYQQVSKVFTHLCAK